MIYAIGKSIIGNRLFNEDHMYINHNITNTSYEDMYDNDEILCFAIADGVGGSSQGDKASYTVLESVEEWFSNYDPLNEIEELQNAFDYFNESVVNFSDEIYEETGTTLTLLLISQGKFYLANIGDSPAFRVRGKEIISIYNRHGEDNFLYSYVGNREKAGNEMVDITTGTCEKGDRFFLCSDGILNDLGEKSLDKLLKKRSITIDKIFKKLKNPKDNCSGILIEVN